jgi:Serine protease Clip domain PPAF-2
LGECTPYSQCSNLTQFFDGSGHINVRFNVEMETEACHYLEMCCDPENIISDFFTSPPRQREHPKGSEKTDKAANVPPREGTESDSLKIICQEGPSLGDNPEGSSTIEGYPVGTMPGTPDDTPKSNPEGSSTIEGYPVGTMPGAPDDTPKTNPEGTTTDTPHLTPALLVCSM